MKPPLSRLSAFLLVLIATQLTTATGHAGVLPREPDGRVRFYNIADSDFDRYSKRPTARDQAWMRDRYVRMQTYSPYFDGRLSWYPSAWVYKDSYAIKRHWTIYSEHPEWILKDARGNRLYIPWGCSKGSCPQFAADVGNPAFRAHWIDEARALIAKGYVGIWVDDVNLAWRVSDGDGDHVTPINPRTGAPMTLGEWQDGFATFMEEIRAAFPDLEIAHNSIWYADAFDNPYVLRQIDAADYVNLERGASDRGLRGGSGRFGFERFLAFIDLVHARGKGVILMDYGKDARAREFGLAAWFLVSTGIDLMSSNQVQWIAPGFFWRGYGLDLGASLGPRYVAHGLMRRDFECGYVLLNPPEAPHARFDLPAGHRRVDGIAGAAIRLDGGAAAVIEHACRTPALHGATESAGESRRSAP